MKKNRRYLCMAERIRKTHGEPRVKFSSIFDRPNIFNRAKPNKTRILKTNTFLATTIILNGRNSVVLKIFNGGVYTQWQILPCINK